MNPHLKRTLCGIAVGLGVIAFFLYCPLRVVPAVLLVISTLVQLEFYQMAKKYEPVSWFGILMGTAWLLGHAAYPGFLGFSACVFTGMIALLPLTFLLSCIVLFSSRYKNSIGTPNQLTGSYFFAIW